MKKKTWKKPTIVRLIPTAISEGKPNTIAHSKSQNLDSIEAYLLDPETKPWESVP